MPQSTAFALVLAAGKSERFGREKLTVEYRGQPLISPVLDTVAAAISEGTLGGGCVVHRPGAQAIEQLTRESGLIPVENPDPDTGLAGSLRAGLAFAAANAAAAIMVLPGDQPGVRLDVIRSLVAAWHQGKGPAIRPRYQGERATPNHPVLLDHTLWSLSADLSGDSGFGALFQKHPELVTTIEVGGSNPDIDTPSDLTQSLSSQ